MPPDDYFSSALRKKEIFVDEPGGIEIGTAEDVLDSVFVTLEQFAGTFSKAGHKLSIDSQTSESHIVALFGQPFWIDRSDGEVILFYEYRHGTIELQFEFSDGRTLSFVTLCQEGVLSKEEQRAAYGVNKAWPPG